MRRPFLHKGHRAGQAPRHELERYAEFMAGMGLAIPSDPWRLERMGRNPVV